MNLSDYLRILRRNWLLIVALALAGLLAGGVASIMTKPTYTAETQLFVAIQSSGSVQELQQGNTFSQARVESYVQTVNSPAVLQPAIDSLGLDLTARELAAAVKASTEPNTVLINVAVSDNSAVQASAIAQAVADSLIKTVDNLEKPKTGGASPVSLSVIKPALAPPAPSSPNTRLNILAGLLLGLAVGVAGALFRSTLDSAIRGDSDLRKVTDAPIIGAISFDQSAVKKPLLTQTGFQSPRAESFRQLRTNLQFANVSGQAKTILLTSSLPGEGKSTTAANLAIALAQSGQVVCLIDADLRRPMIHDYLGLDRSVGLTTALVGEADIDDLLQHWGEDGLYVLTSGQLPPNPSELLGSSQMRTLLERLELAFDVIIVDAPPLLPVTDAAVLSQSVGGVVLVVGTQKLKQRDLEKSLTALELVGAHMLGVVLNRVPAKGPDAYSYGYGYESTEHAAETPKRWNRSGTRSASQKQAALPPLQNLASSEPQRVVEERPPRVFPVHDSN
ncbi:polysaccharide biosynthesis tyrosine autokinase [Pseudarthrobacter chlorophenolicus]|uniref:polysaccharide biosynthesis tyrosine autokinase n=1 Tax=Pseudarthrobacter chlorophenolicus TaxID=85085 RepID=UPI0009E4DB14|nr:polysaccharide biosynthesis tyrosine autokinase [Pseudarthrobacter chlorophenolicus]